MVGIVCSTQHTLSDHSAIFSYNSDLVRDLRIIYGRANASDVRNAELSPVAYCSIKYALYIPGMWELWLSFRFL